jgi:hypothetical protein
MVHPYWAINLHKELEGTGVQAAHVGRTGAPMDIARLRGPLAELLEDAAGGDEEGVVNPYAEAMAQAVLGPYVPRAPG